MNEIAKPSSGWFKTIRSNDALELIRKNSSSYALAAIIAHRARWREGFNADGLLPGEALLGDYEKCGMTRQQYRTALAQLRKFNFVTTRTTNKGTIARLADTRLFDPLNLTSNQPDNQQTTTAQPPASQQATTNEEGKNAKKEIKGESNKPPLAINDLHSEQTELMEICRDVLGAEEMKRCHKRWLERAETKPNKLRRVLADVRAEKRQHEIKNLGAYAEDIWQRFSN